MYFSTIIIFFIFYLDPFHLVLAIEPYTLKVCHVSSAVGAILPRANDITLINSGFILGVQDFNSTNKHKIKWVTLNSDHKKIDILQAIYQAGQIGCRIVVGIVSTRDALLAAPLLKKLKILGISSTATADEMRQSYPHLISLAPSQRSQVQFIQSYLLKINRTTDLFLIEKKDDFFSILLTEKFLEIDSHFKVFKLESGNLLKSPDIDQIRNSQAPTLIYSTYPIHSLPSLIQIAEIKHELSIPPLILGTSPWLETQAFKSHSDLFRILTQVFVFPSWDFEPHLEKMRQIFFSHYLRQFGTRPDHDSVHDYDTLSMIGQCMTQVSSQEVVHCLTQERNFVGILGRYQYKKGDANPTRKLKPKNYDGTELLPFFSYF